MKNSDQHDTAQRIACLIVAGGSGTRLGADRPKQFLPLLGKPILRWTLEAFLSLPEISMIQLVIGADDLATTQSDLADLNLLPITAGGESRQQSVSNGLEALAAHGPDLVLIHDAARPFCSPQLIRRIITSVRENGSAVPAIEVADSLRKGEQGRLGESVDRSGLYQMQTPQGFHFQDILGVHRQAADDINTDDAEMARKAGYEVHLCEGEAENFKITYHEDLARGERHLLSRFNDIRIGQGFDVHRFAPGDRVTLGGVDIPHDQTLSGHSDADVAMHAATDALLGAVGQGDIGAHFPPSDPQWKGCASEVFLRHAGKLIADRGGVIGHLDLTVICEAPKIGPYRDAMRQRLADILQISTERVSVKATTTEKLGFTGRKEGIAAQAIATIRLGER